MPCIRLLPSEYGTSAGPLATNSCAHPTMTLRTSVTTRASLNWALTYLSHPRLVIGLANDDTEAHPYLGDETDKTPARVVPFVVRCPVVRPMLDDAGSHEPSRRVTLPIGREAIWRQSGQDRNLHDGPTVRTVEMVPIRGRPTWRLSDTTRRRWNYGSDSRPEAPCIRIEMSHPENMRHSWRHLPRVNMSSGY